MSFIHAMHIYFICNILIFVLLLLLLLLIMLLLLLLLNVKARPQLPISKYIGINHCIILHLFRVDIKQVFTFLWMKLRNLM